MDLAALKESLSRPTPPAIDALRDIEGDLVVLGAGGKMGPSFARMAARGFEEIGSEHSVMAVARFSDPAAREEIESSGARTIACDLLDRDAVAALPDAGAVAFLVGTKFGTSDDAAKTWALNAWLPGIVADRYRGVPTVVFSSGNVYPFVPVDSGGATEDTPIAPVGEYAQSVVARERIFEHFSREHGTPTTIYRLNYAAELRYGVPLDIALRVHRGEPVDLANGHCNVIWQGDANAMALACFSVAASPPRVLNVTGGETLSVRDLATRFGKIFDRTPTFDGAESDSALLSNASKAIKLFGPLRVTMDELTQWIGDWVKAGGPTHDKPTHFEVRDGAF
jgi:nucleoside-diphosphate-sugar epimerase